jgi:site-specific DNA recombinase
MSTWTTTSAVANTLNRPALARLMAALPKRGKPPFEALIMSESSRLGRDTTRNASTTVEIVESDVRIFYYLTGEEEKADTPEAKGMLTFRSMFGEMERIKAGQRSRDALQRRAAKGYNSGGCVFGYDNVPVFNGEKKQHTDYRINPEQADTIRRIFRMYADGYGHVTVARTLNRDPAYAAQSKSYFAGGCPTPQRNGTGSWAPSSIRKMLYNERYAGVISWGRKKKAIRKGTKVRLRQREEDVLRVPRQDLRIIDEKLWGAVQTRLAAVRRTYVRDTDGRLWGRPGAGIESRYLLSGMGTCGCCGHNISASGGRSGSPGRRTAVYYYRCGYNATRGRTICTNDHRTRLEEADSRVIDLMASFLTPEAVDWTIDEALRQLAERQSADVESPKLIEAELRKERRQIERLVAALAEGRAEAVVAKIRALELSIAEKEQRLKVITFPTPSTRDIRALREAFRERLSRFRELIYADVPVARQALRKLVDGRIQFVPVERDGARTHDLRWNVRVGALAAPGYQSVASPRGFEPYTGDLILPLVA